MTQIISVTPELVTAMNQAQKFDAALSERRVNDANSYNDTVEVLNRLTSAVLVATASTPLLTVSIVGPRFDAAGEGLTARMQNSIEYLRKTASALIQNPHNLNRYERKETDAALIRLRTLYSHLASAIEDQVVQDVRAARDKGAVHLTELAKVVSTFVRRPQPAGDQTTGDVPRGADGEH